MKLFYSVPLLSFLSLSGCNLSTKSCQVLSSVLGSSSSSLVELDLSNNNLHDSGVALLCTGLASPHCHLKTLRFFQHSARSNCEYLSL